MRYYLAHGLTGPRAHGHTSPQLRTAIALAFRQPALKVLIPKTIKARVSTIKKVLILRPLATFAEHLDRESKKVGTLVVEQISNLFLDLAGKSRAVAGKLRLRLAAVKPLANP